MNLINHDLIKNSFSFEHVNQIVNEIPLSMHDSCVEQMMDLRVVHVRIKKETKQINELDGIA